MRLLRDVPESHVFAGWSRTPATTTVYGNSGDTVVITDTIDLYSKWEEVQNGTDDTMSSSTNDAETNMYTTDFARFSPSTPINVKALFEEDYLAVNTIVYKAIDKNIIVNYHGKKTSLCGC